MIFEGVRRSWGLKISLRWEHRGLGDELKKILWHEQTVPIRAKTYKLLQDHKEKFKVFRLPAVTGLFWKEVNQLWSVMKRAAARKHLAQQALSYLVEEHDVVPDNLGVFGLVDDVEATVGYRAYQSIEPL